MNNCLITTNQIEELASKIEGETVETVKGLISLWQEKNNKDIDTYPTVSELNQFKTEQRNQSVNEEDTTNQVTNEESQDNILSTIDEQDSVYLDFDLVTREDRTVLISRLFSKEVDSELQREKDLLNSRIENTTGVEREQLILDLNSLDRMSIIRRVTPSKIFERVLNVFQSYVEDTDEGRVQAELNSINANEQLLVDEGIISEADRTPDDKKLSVARDRAEYKNQEYKKVIKNFRPLAEEAGMILKTTENIILSSDYNVSEDVNFSEDDPDGNIQLNDQINNEETPKDGWMFNFREVSSHESLSEKVRKFIGTIPKLDYEGKYEEDDLGNLRYLNPAYVHISIMNELKDMITVKDMVPLLEKFSNKKLWVSQVIEAIEEDDALFSSFYQDFRRDFTSYWVQKSTTSANGDINIKTFPVNESEGTSYLINSWRDNYESRTPLDKDSVYDNKGDINIDNATKGLEWVNTLIDKFSKVPSRSSLLEEDRIFNTVVKLLNMIGIDVNPSILNEALTEEASIEGVSVTPPITLLLEQLKVVYSGIVKGKVTQVRADGSKVTKDLINTFSSVYNTVADMLNDVIEDAVESSARENGKSYFSYTNPNYLGKIIKQLKNVSNSKEDFDKFINDEYKQYKFFYKDGRWRNDWLSQIVESEKIRDGLKHKVLLNFNKIEYADWDEIDYTTILFNEYYSTPDDSRSNIKWAWYHVPILADAQSAEFIRFRKYISGVEYNNEGNSLSYQDIILDKMVDLVSQEYDRIMFVRALDEAAQNGDPTIPHITNYTIIRDGNGKIKNIGGTEFKFLPILNSIKYDNGEVFLDRLSKMSVEDTGDNLRTFIKDTLYDIMEEGFEAEYKHWYDIGFLSEKDGKYKYLPFNGQSNQNMLTAKALTKAKDILGSDWNSSMEQLLDDYNSNNPIDDRVANNLFVAIKLLLNNRNDISRQEYTNISNNLTIKNNAKEALREYYWNSKFATSQIIEILTTDLAYYKNMEDFQKRFKEVHAPSIRLNTQAMYKGKRIGRDWERTIYLMDDEITSSVLKDIESVILSRHKSGELSDYDAAYILSKYGYVNHIVDKKGKKKKYAKVGKVMVPTSYVNVADAQAYRSLSSYRAILGMSGQWTDDMETAYNNLKNGTWNAVDFNILWQPKKPFVYTQTKVDTGIEDFDRIKMPVQHKNSEFLLLAIYDTIADSLGKSNKLKAINDFMENNNIDVVQFESAVKVGKQGVINLNTKISQDELDQLDNKLSSGNITLDQYNTELNSYKITSYEDTISVLKNSIFQNGVENPNVVHRISYEDYGIQTNTPEHAIDKDISIPTQIRRLITADISEDAELSVNGMNLSKKEWLDLYNAINVENLLDSFEEVRDIFKDKKEVEKIILEEIKGNQRYGIDLARSCTLNNDGQFNDPLYDPTHSQLMQNLLFSIIKNRITKQKIKGGSLIQVSNYGLSDDLHIEFEGKGENKRIKYFECYMPAYSRKFLEPLMDVQTHQLNIDKLPDDLRKAIGLRIPTEDKYSMAPLYIKGFLPMQSGAAIMLPSEITTVSGSDFDIDKMYAMFQEFDLVEYDYKKAFNDFKTEQKVVKELSSLFNKDGNILSDLEETPIEFKEWFNNTKEDYKYDIPKVEKIRYNNKKLPQEQSRKARNNMLLDLMYGVLTNKDTTSKILNPGGFDNQKKAARIVDILTYGDMSILSERFGKNIINKLMEMNLEELTSLVAESKPFIDPLSPVTQTRFHKQNMTGAKLIGIYANHNSSHALIQHTLLEVNPVIGGFKLNNNESLPKDNNGNSVFSLHSIKNGRGEFISRNNSGYLAASVDNVKDPVLASLNQNALTADVTMYLSRLGYTPIEIGLFMNQPVVISIVNNYFREKNKGKGVIIDNTIKEYGTKANVTNIGALYESQDIYDEYINRPFLLEELANNILNSRRMETLSEKDRINFYESQFAVGLLFKRIMKGSEELSSIVQSTKADAQNGAAGPTIASTQNKISKAREIFREKEFPVLLNYTILNTDISVDGANKDYLRKSFLNSRLPFLQAFYTLGIDSVREFLSPYFPHFTEPFTDVVYKLIEISKNSRLSDKTLNNIYNDLLAYIMSKTEFFGSDDSMNSSDKRNYFINDFPKEFIKIRGENEDIAELGFIERLSIKRADSSCPIDRLVFGNAGKLKATLKEEYMKDWTSLLYMENPVAQKLALDLFRYSYYRNGFSFGPSTYNHLASLILKKAVPDYIDTLRSLLTSQDNYDEFVDQYIYNHLDNRELVPVVSDDTTVEFTDENGNIKDNVTFTIDSNSSVSDRSVVKSTDIVDGYPVYTFFDYISKNISGNPVYYRLIKEDNVTYLNEAEYERFAPLGYRNNFLEYEYGKNASDMVSVIDESQRNSAYEESEFDSQEAWDSYEREDFTPSIKDDIATAQTLHSILGLEESGATSVTESATSIEPNTDYKDADGKVICGVENLKNDIQ